MDKIKEGDKVTVNCYNAMTTICHEAIVLHIPVATGDCWQFLDPEGNLHYISEGITITKRNFEKSKGLADYV